MPELIDLIRTVIDTERTRFEVPGCAVVVVQDGEVLLSEGFGKRNAEQPVTSKTLFPIGSSTKTFTAAVLAALVDEGTLDFDKPIRSYLPGFRMMDPVATEQLTVRDCLSHRSGLPRHDLIWYAGDGILSRDDIIAALAYLPASKPFRQNWQYNNLLYITAGHLAGKLSGGSYEDAVQSRILDPLGMTRTNFDVQQVQKDADFSQPYAQPLGESVINQVPFASLNLAGPAGNINSCADELAPWLLTLLGHGVDGKQPLLSAGVLGELRTPTMAMGSLPSGEITQIVGYGLAQIVEDYRGRRLTHHGGNIDGFASQVLTSPTDGIGIAVLTNLGGSALRDALPYLILDVIDGVEPAGHGEKLHERSVAMLKAAAGGRELAAADNKPLGPVRPLEDYIGSYLHPGYGTMTVSEGLSARYLGFPEMRLEHKHLEVFDLVFHVAGDEQRIPAQFTHDLTGEVDAVLVQLEGAVPPLRFEREASTAHLTGELLDSLVGDYLLGPVTALVGRRGDKELLITVAGQPAQLLRPVSGRVFMLDTLKLEFTEDGRILSAQGEFIKQ